MISYAQNFEDVMLARALTDVETGFYVDVGAWDPWHDSVTAHFYLKGWRGVNIEPVPAYAAALRAARERDVTIEAAAARSGGRMRFHVFEGSGLSTLEHRLSFAPDQVPFPHALSEVETVVLDDVFAAHAPADVHFLKLDCEGGEQDALAGLDLARRRPWIILLEALAPLTLAPTHADWEPMLLAADYRPVWFDGLNRFYVAGERHERLAPAFAAPPNVFDGIEPARYVAAIADLRRENEDLRRRLDEAGPAAAQD